MDSVFDVSGSRYVEPIISSMKNEIAAYSMYTFRENMFSEVNRFS
jgi:hypothetical protein